MRSLVSFGIEIADGASFRTSERVVVERFRCAASCLRLTVSGRDCTSVFFGFRGIEKDTDTNQRPESTKAIDNENVMVL